MDKVKANVKVKKHILIHNDLQQAAFNFKERVEQLARTDDREGIGYEMMACLVFLAFAVEANFNFLGYKLIGDWDEWQPTIDKVKVVLKQLGLNENFDERPYKTIVELKQFRDALAHGKPREEECEEEMVATEEELRKRGSLSASYENFLKQELIRQAYEDVETIWKRLLDRSGLNIVDTITRGGIDYTIIGESEETIRP